MDLKPEDDLEAFWKDTDFDDDLCRSTMMMVIVVTTLMSHLSGRLL